MTFWQKLAVFWNSTPHIVQAIIVLVGGDVVDAVYSGLTAPNQCWAWHCLGALALAGLRTGIVGVGGLYLKSSLYK